MSSLSPQECTAGISRKALETIKQQGGNGDSPHKPAPPAKPTQDFISLYRETSVIDTPMRKLAVLETRDADIIVRNVEFIGTRADCSLVHLEPEQAHALAAVLMALENKAAGDPPEAKGPVRRVRA